MTTMTKWVEWSEPMDAHGVYNKVCRVRYEEAVLFQRKYAMEVHGHVYDSDEIAAEDFLTNHWGWIKEYEE